MLPSALPLRAGRGVVQEMHTDILKQDNGSFSRNGTKDDAGG